jgi:hypothetical protein
VAPFFGAIVAVLGLGEHAHFPDAHRQHGHH